MNNDLFNEEAIMIQKICRGFLTRKWINKWGRMPNYDKDTFVVPITDTGVTPCQDFYENLKYFEK